ncbi:MerR family transcriptional regulator [Alkalicoccobacillus gibsonii]|uniref:MerR family transcriptional regulator n=1 Tax=Alkalicoccobacillus gibsonii TaxID=79881 RepID=A0ABU9VMD9_9BACI|nr:MerR family transcriptional regulator [Alkalicoccobacillus gibsonii]
MSHDIPPRQACFPIRVVMEMTDLSARQIRYYEEQGLVKPDRNEGNQRMFSLFDIERLNTVKAYIQKGINIAGIKAIMSSDG